MAQKVEELFTRYCSLDPVDQQKAKDQLVGLSIAEQKEMLALVRTPAIQNSRRCFWRSSAKRKG